MVNRLEIVNHILFNLGQAVQVSLNTQHPDVLQAKAIMESNDIDFQSRGWWFNKEFGMNLTYDEYGHVSLPDSTLSMQVVRCPYWTYYYAGEHNLRYVMRSGKLYDTVLHTFALNTSITVNINIQLDIPDLPPCAGIYLKHLCAEKAVLADDGDKQKIEQLAQYRLEAWNLLKQEELKATRPNALNSPAAANLRYRVAQNASRTNPFYPGG